jgi:hypothetical protein
LNKTSFVASLVGLVMAAGCAAPQASGPYQVNIPEEWQQDLSVGRLAMVDSAFYGVPWHLGESTTRWVRVKNG